LRQLVIARRRLAAPSPRAARRQTPSQSLSTAQ
jgi:hypothetical protein